MKDNTADTKKEAITRWKKIYYDKARNSYLKCTYGITLVDYNKMLAAQNNSCAICGNADAGIKRGKYNTFCVDHNHDTRKIRGLLCMSCNIAVLPTIEYYKDRIPAAESYLKKYS